MSAEDCRLHHDDGHGSAHRDDEVDISGVVNARVGEDPNEVLNYSY